MLSKKLQKLSPQLAFVLRHEPESAGLEKSVDGFYPTSRVASHLGVTVEELALIVAHDTKQRYSFNEDATMIRANQGHSYWVDPEKLYVACSVQDLAPVLYHGTSASAAETIQQQGMLPMSRQFCHLTENLALAQKRAITVAQSDEPIAIEIDTAALFCYTNSVGEKVLKSSNGVILVRHVPASCLVTAQKL